MKRVKELFLDNELFLGTEEQFASIRKFMSKRWKINGKLHRGHGLPAVVVSNKGQEWWVDGSLHRIGGPAQKWPNSLIAWWENGKRHRDDGPAYIEISKYGLETHWYINDEPMSWIDEWFPLSYWICGDEV